MNIKNLSPGGYAANSYLVSENDTAILIDAAVPPAELAKSLLQSGTVLRAILCTHGHFDHLLTAASLTEKYRVPLFLHKQDLDFPGDGEKNASLLFFGESRTYAHASDTLFGGETLSFGPLSFRVLHTPGHTGGCVTYLCGDTAFTGDTLFANCIGRTDLYGSSFSAIQRSLETLSSLPPDTYIYPGHGRPARLGDALRDLH